MNSIDRTDSLAEALRAEARAFDPAPPAGLRRRVTSALAAIETPPAARPFAFGRLAFAGTALAAAIVAAVVLLRPPTPAHHPSRIVVTPRPVSTSITFASANPQTLTQRWLNEPLESEYQQIVAKLEEAGRTVKNVLPAASPASKGTRPAGSLPVSPTTTGV